MALDYNMTPFWDGVTECIVASLPNPDEGRKKYRLIEGLLANLFMKVVGPEVVMEAYKSNPELIIEELKKYDIEPNKFKEFVRLIGEARNPNTEEKDSFSEAQYILLEMFSKKVVHQFSNGELHFKSIRPSITRFSGALVPGKHALLSLFPDEQVKHLYLNKDDLESAIANNIRKAEDECRKKMVTSNFNGEFIVPKKIEPQIVEPPKGGCRVIR